MNKRIVKLLIITGITISGTLNAQKFAHVYGDSIMARIPAALEMQGELQRYVQKKEQELVSMQKSYENALKEYQSLAKDTPDAIKLSREQNIQEMAQNIQKYQMDAEQRVQQKQQELLAPIYDSVQKAIKKVAKNKGYTYVFSAQALLYAGGDNITALVEQELSK